MRVRSVQIGGYTIGDGQLAFIAGPCVIESEGHVLNMANALRELFESVSAPFVFKASFDKANRSSVDSYRGPGLDRGVEILSRVRRECGVPIITDIHTPDQAERIKDTVDALQIPAFLCRQTDLLVAAGRTGLPVNIKKGQMVQPEAMGEAARKVERGGGCSVLLCERGTTFGYGNLVVDMRSLVIMRELGYPVVFDATHSVQLPGATGTASGGNRRFAPVLARAAVAVGVDAIFMEVHDDPDAALCDGPNMLPLSEVGSLVASLIAIHETRRRTG